MKYKNKEIQRQGTNKIEIISKINEVKEEMNNKIIEVKEEINIKMKSKK